MTDRPVELILYTARGCHLCDAMKDVIRRAGKRRALTLREIDISGDPELEARYRPSIPVLCLEGRMLCKYATTVEELLARIDRPVAAGPGEARNEP